jgi:hypothetical protein
VTSELLGLDTPLAFGQDVRQLVFPGGRLLAELLTAAAAGGPRPSGPLNEIVYRGKMANGASVPPNLRKRARCSPRRPGRFRPGRLGPHVENGLALITVGMVSPWPCCDAPGSPRSR